MPDIQITGDTYTVVVQAPDVLPGPPRPWLVRAFRAGEREPLVTSEHFDVEHACAEVFHQVRLDIGRRMERGIQAGICDAIHNGDGSDAHLDAVDFDRLTEEQIARLVVRLDALLAEHPQVLAHSQRNMAGQFAFSPATCPLCKQQAELEVQAHAEIVAEPAGAAT